MRVDYNPTATDNTVIDTQIAGNRAHQRDLRKNLITYRPSSVGLPSYLDDYCSARLECILPFVDFTGQGNYQDFGGTIDGGIWVTTYQGQSNVTHVRGSHTWRGGVDVQWAQRTSRDGAGRMGTFNFDNTYTRAADPTNVFPAQPLGLSLAAFRLGIPTQVSIDDNNGFDVRNIY
ncbi:MAG: outer membrane beta-barrel protein, partial [Mycobacterium sp.]